MLSIARQLIDLGLFVPERKVVRHLRQIVGANTGHTYSAKLYAEYSDGEIEFLRDIALSIDKTNVRLRVVGSSVWEESVTGCPGWFRCAAPDGIK